MVTNELNKVTYTGDGSQTSFEITFPVLTDGNKNAFGIAVALLRITGETVYLVKDTDYSISGKNIVAVVAPAVAEKLMIYRQNEQTQKIDFVNNDAIDADILELALDKLTMSVQELSERTNRVVTQEITDGEASLVFPPAAARANAFLSFDENGNIDVQTGAYPRTWYIGFPFRKNEICQHNGLFYKSKHDDNSGNEPPAIGETSIHWDEFKTGGNGGLPNYIDDRAGSYNADQGFTITTETAAPIEEGGCIKIVKDAVNRQGTGWYQDVVISEIDLNSLLQQGFYLESDDADKISIKISDTDADPDAVLLDEVITDVSEKNAATGIYHFSRFVRTTGNKNVRVYFYLNSTSDAAMTFKIASVALGAPFYYTAPVNNDSAGKMYYSAEAPVDGVNADGDLVMDGVNTYQWADYPDLEAKKTELDNVYIIDGGTTFQTKNKLQPYEEIVEITDTTPSSFEGYKSITYPDGFNEFNSRIISAEWFYGGTQAWMYTGIGGVVSGMQLRLQTAGLSIYNNYDHVNTFSQPTKIVLGRVDSNPDYAYLKAKNLRSVELMAKQTNRNDVAELIYTSKAPDASGKGSDGNLVFDSSFTHNWSEYPELSAIKADLGMYITDLGSTFKMKSLSFDSGWVANSNWADEQFAIAHSLGSPLSELNVKFIISTDGTEANSFEVNNIVQTAGSGSVESAGWNLYASDDNNFIIQTGDNGIVYMLSTGGISLLDDEAWYYKVVVSRKDAPQAGTYAYLRTKSLSTVIAAENLNQPGYNGSTYRPDVADISSATGGNVTYDLNQYLSTGSSPKLDGWKIRVGWTGGDATYAHTISSSLNLWNEYVDLPPGDNSSTFAWCGYGSGGLTLIKDEANSRWIVDTDGAFDKYARKFEQFTNGILECAETYTSETYNTSASGNIYGATLTSRDFPLPFKVSPEVAPTLRTTNSSPIGMRIVSLSGTAVTFRIYASIDVTITSTLSYRARGEWRD